MAWVKKDGSPSRSIDEDERAAILGYRNFTSFIFSEYYAERKSLTECGRKLGVSSMKIRKSILSRGWPVRNKKQVPRKKKLPKRTMNLDLKVKTYTQFIFPWCALYVYYIKYGMTTYEIASALHLSQASISKLLKKFKIKRRKKGPNNA